MVAYPTDTCYGLAVDATNSRAVKKLYLLKGRNFNKPVHVVVPSASYAKKLVSWNQNAAKLAKEFWPGALTLVLPIIPRSPAKKNSGKNNIYRQLSAGDGFLGLRMPKHKVALDLAKALGRPITATSANVSGQPNCYSIEEITQQFKNQKLRPDIIINTGRLRKRKSSTVVRIFDDVAKVLREGPVSEKQVQKVLGIRF